MSCSSNWVGQDIGANQSTTIETWVGSAGVAREPRRSREPRRRWAASRGM